MNQEVNNTDNTNGHDDIKPESEPVNMNQDLHSTNEKNDDKESHSTTTHQAVHSTDNNNDPTVSNLESAHEKNNIGNFNKQSELVKNASQKKAFQEPVESVVSEDKPSSLELRRLPIDVLLKPGSLPTSSVDESQAEEEELESSESPRGFLRMTCLKPTFGLRTQLLLAFGSVSAFIVTFVLIVSVIIVWTSGENLKSINQASFEDLIIDIEGNSARYLAESFTPSLIPDDVVRILYESARDRFAGYPNDGDEFVPFFDIDSQTNKYPVVGVTGKSLPLDWQIDANVNDDNHEEHFQGRWSWYGTEPAISTAHSFYVMQGMCDPSVTDPSAFTYWENCTEANNDVSTGGVVTPSPTNDHVYRKANSISPILKAVFESHPDVRDLGIFFSNGGAGSGVQFPHILLRSNVSYTSIGCEWMKKPNPYDPSRPIGTTQEIARCRKNGTVVSTRLYNNLERAWCRDQALNPFRPIVDGPYLDAWKNRLVVTAGQGIYDRVTNDFIGCIYIGSYLDNLEDIISKSRVTENSEVSVARYDEGTTVASTAWNSSNVQSTVKIYDLNVGVTFDSYEELKALIDYNKIWDPSEVRETYETFTLRHDDFLVAAYPMPPVPDYYDPSYVPLFFVMLSTPEDDIFQVVEDVKGEVDDHMKKVIYLSLIVGAIGLAIVLLLIYMMSKALTAPLEYMNAAADEIINHFGNTSSSTKKTASVTPTHVYRCSPRTELNNVVEEFNKMVTSFSGSFASVSKSVKGGREDIPNGFDMQNDFDELYGSRKDSTFDYDFGSIGSSGTNLTHFINLGSNITSNDQNMSKAQSVLIRRDNKGVLTSRLFLWTVVLIGTPLLLTTIAMSAIVMYNMSREFQSSIEAAESFYLKVEVNALSVYAKLRAGFVSSGTSRPTRDLYLLTRYTSWLLFGGVERAMSFTRVKTGAEQCKTFPDKTTCPFHEQNYFCDCAWNDRFGVCSNHTFDTRHFQDLHFLCEADTLQNGDRNSTSFPNLSYSPESVILWDDVNALPGSAKGALASGYETTYDRLRVISASPLHQLVYNKDVEKEYTVSNSIAMEADGLFMGFFGCSTILLEVVGWSSTEENGAYKLRPELCPLGKYGYDPRCRGWYDTGKKLAEADGTPLHITPPYVYAGANVDIGQSATSPLIDPQTKEHVGQALIDFISGPIFESLDDKNTPLADGGFPFLITALPGADSVIGPGFSFLNESARPISELVLPNDHKCNETECALRREQFDQIMFAMKSGSSGTNNFTRRTPTGSIETVYIAYAPVVLKGYRPLDSSDFASGVDVRDVLIYSLALAETESGLLEPFEQIEEETNKKIKVSIAVLSVIIFLSLLFVIYIMSVVTLSVSDPMLDLLDVIHSINRLKVDEEPLIVNRSNGSKELIRVADTIQTLYKVVRSGNYAFFHGDLEQAYAVLYDASRLFDHLDNKKAIGVVSNNLGNLLLVAYRTMDEDNQTRCCGMSKEEVISKGITFFHDAIELGERAYDEFHEMQGWSPNCLDFMQHLSNRYFNRGMFLLTVKDGHAHPDTLKKQAYRDLEIARDMDMEIVESGLQAGWGHVTSALKKFDVALARAKGYLVLQELGYPDDWEVDEILDDAFMMVKKEVEKDTPSTLFDTVAVAGRLQEIETELIRYKLLKGEVRLAAQIGIRMLVEDEFTFPEAQETALEALSLYIDQSMDVDEDKRAELKHRLASCNRTLICVIDDMDKSRMSMPPSETEESLLNLTAMKRSVGESEISQASTRRSTIRESRRGYLTFEEF